MLCMGSCASGAACEQRQIPALKRCDAIASVCKSFACCGNRSII